MSNDTTPTKTCTKCKAIFPATREYFHKNRGGLASSCKSCVKLYFQDNKTKIDEYRRQYREKNREYYTEHARKWREANPEYLRQYREKNKDKIKQDYQANKEMQRQKSRLWYQNNKERARQYRQNNRESNRKASRRYYQSNKKKILEYRNANTERNRVYLSNRLARKRDLPNTLTSEQWQIAIDYFHGCCCVCGRQLKDLFGTHTVAADHWIPLSYKGDDNPGTVVTNIVPLCHGENGCNNSKINKMPDAWLIERCGKQKASQILKRIETYFEYVRESGNSTPTSSKAK